MRIRSTTAAVLVAAGLSVTVTGAAAAGEPEPDDVVFVTCEGGELVVREPTDEERDRMRVRPARPAEVHERRAVPALPGEPREGIVHVAPAPGHERIRTVPAEPGDPPKECVMRAEPRVDE